MKSIFVIMVLLVLPLYLFCQIAPSGEGTIGNPYLISNIGNLRFIANDDTYWNSGKCFKQTADIDAFQTHTWNEGKGFSSIGNDAKSFQGVYDGQGFLISNLYIDREDEQRCSLFGKIENAIIKNVNTKNINFKCNRIAGGIVGHTLDSFIYNCSSDGSIESTYYISYCGGITGLFMGNSLIENCYSSVNIIGGARIGGIAGNIQNDSIIENCYFTGSLSGTIVIGGIVGLMFDDTQPTIANCYSTAEISYTDSSSCGMIVGTNMTHNIFSCIYQEGSGLGGVGSSSGVNSFTVSPFQELSEIEMQESTNYTDVGWDFNTTWLLDDITLNNGYPYLYWQQETPYSHFTIGEETTQALSSPETYSEIVFDSELTVGTQVLINLHDIANTSMSGLTNSQQVIGSNYWEINTTMTSPVSYALSLSLQNLPELLDVNQVKMLKREDDESVWQDVDSLGASLSWDENVVTITGLSSFSDFIPVIDESTLPVELSSFSANLIDNNTLSVNWVVESESNMLGYYLLKNNTNNLANAQEIPSLIHATNSPQHQSYSVITHPDNNDCVVYYWLKSVELSNHAEYYGPVYVNLNDGNNNYPVISVGDKLFENYPNPFNPSTTISFSVKKPQFVEIEIYNIKGQLVKHLLSQYINKTDYKHSILWNGEDDDNKSVSSGTYLFHLKLENKTFTQKAILVK